MVRWAVVSSLVWFACSDDAAEAKRYRERFCSDPKLAASPECAANGGGIAGGGGPAGGSSAGGIATGGGSAAGGSATGGGGSTSPVMVALEVPASGVRIATCTPVSLLPAPGPTLAAPMAIDVSFADSGTEVFAETTCNSPAVNRVILGDAGIDIAIRTHAVGLITATLMHDANVVGGLAFNSRAISRAALVPKPGCWDLTAQAFYPDGGALPSSAYLNGLAGVFGVWLADSGVALQLRDQNCGGGAFRNGNIGMGYGVADSPVRELRLGGDGVDTLLVYIGNMGQSVPSQICTSASDCVSRLCSNSVCLCMMAGGECPQGACCRGCQTMTNRCQ